MATVALDSELSERYLRVTEVMVILGLGSSKTWNLVRGGVIRSVKIGKSRRVPASAIREFLATCVAGSAS